jgi:hypothetical protein
VTILRATPMPAPHGAAEAAEGEPEQSSAEPAYSNV